MSKLPSPPEFGLPAKFDQWRNGQDGAVLRVLDSPNRFTALAAPTGFGKSLAYVGAAHISGGRTAVVTSTKGLQDQVERDFKDIGAVSIKGKQNYRCSGIPGMTCAEGHVARCPNRCTNSCGYTRAQNAAMRSSLVITNYSYWMMSHKYGTGLGTFDMLVLDEAHNAPEELAGIMSTTLSHHEINDMLGRDFPKKGKTDLQVWKEWAHRMRAVCKIKTKDAEEKIKRDGVKQSWIQTFNHLKNLQRKLTVVSLLRPHDWVVDEVDVGFQFDPITPARYGESTLFMAVPKVVLVSATIRPKTLTMMGADTDYNFEEYPAVFDPARSPIYHVPTIRVDFRTRPEDLRILMLRADQIIGRRLDRKGIIHTVSFDRRNMAVQTSSHARYMTSNWEGDVTSDVVAKFRSQSAPRILVSPSISTGYDFPGQDCEYQIVLKVPFPVSKSKVVKARQELDKEYGTYLAMQQLVQAFGRGMRFEEDRCEGFLLDDHALWALPKNRHLLPKWFQRQMKFVNTLPEPAPKL